MADSGFGCSSCLLDFVASFGFLEYQEDMCVFGFLGGWGGAPCVYYILPTQRVDALRVRVRQAAHCLDLSLCGGTRGALLALLSRLVRPLLELATCVKRA